MADYRQRDEYTFWSNPKKISDVNEALSVLLKDLDAIKPTHLKRSLIGIFYVWEIVVPWYCEGSSGGDTAGTDYYDVTDEVADHLNKEELVEPYLEIGWGFKHLDIERLVITKKAAAAFREYQAILRDSRAA